MMTPVSATHNDLANAIRFLAIDAIQKAGSGHPGMPMGMADVATVLFTRFLKFDVTTPHWPDRDRFILSAGHGSMLLYALAYLTGYSDITIEEIKNFRQLGAKTAGHPEYGHLLAAETTTGPLGQGIANAVGFALAEKMLRARYNEVVNHYTYVLAGDGCLMEGISQEAISFAGYHKLNKLIVLWDNNQICIDGDTSKVTSDDQFKRFSSSNWNVIMVDGYDPEAIFNAIVTARESSDHPTMISCKTIIGYGAPTLAGSEKVHGTPLGPQEITGTRENLNWPYAPFEIPYHILETWRRAGRRGKEERRKWEQKLERLTTDVRVEFERAISGDLPDALGDKINIFKKRVTINRPSVATRKASETVLEMLLSVVPELIGGSADLTHSNLTLVKGMPIVTPDDARGRYLHWGVREHLMAAAMNGIALHGGFIPYGGTFLVFSDYCRPAIRLSGLMKQRVIYVMTHDSIGLGEDGPTHQPIEHIPSLRAIPNILVFRPADAIETVECWALALENRYRPSILCLSRQSLPTVRIEYTGTNLCARGGYILRGTSVRTVTIFATGSEVEIALEAYDILKKRGISTTVISMVSWELFQEQSLEYRESIIDSHNEKSVRVAIEAAGTFGWERYVGTNGVVLGMKSFGASAPSAKLYTHFGITAEAVVRVVESRL